MKLKLRTWHNALIVFLILVVIFSSQYVFKHYDIFGFQKSKGIIQTEVEKITFEDIFKWFNFSDKRVLDDWKNKIFKGKTIYWIDENNNEKFLHSKSEKTASALYHLVNYKVKNFPILAWRWRPWRFPNKTGVTDPKLKDDYALRLYVIFASGFFTNYRCVEYIWDETLKEGTKLVSPYSDKIMQLVIRSGPGSLNWVDEERNVLEDYISLFGGEPNSNIRAIAIMSDSDGTQDSCEANFRAIKIIKRL